MKEIRENIANVIVSTTKPNMTIFQTVRDRWNGGQTAQPTETKASK